MAYRRSIQKKSLHPVSLEQTNDYDYSHAYAPLPACVPNVCHSVTHSFCHRLTVRLAVYLTFHGSSGYPPWGYAFADGYLVGLNLYDMQVYSIGKGPSATTISASPKVSMYGSSVLIEGSVIDTAAGTK
jgi:hypothetical protein